MYNLALVTVLYKCDDVLEGFFKSLSEQTYKDYCLHIIDNSPSDTTDEKISILSALYPLPAFTHKKCDENIGVAAGNNIGIKKSLQDGATYTLIINNDIEFYQKDLFENILFEAKEKNECLIIPKIYFFGTKQIWMAGGEIKKYRATSVHIGEGDDDGAKYDIEKYFDYAPTCFMVIKNDVFRKVGLMDEKYFVYYDDTDFIYRANKFGYKIFYQPKYEVYHKVSFSTGGDETVFSIYYGTRNRVYFIHKNLKGIHFIGSSVYTFISKIIKYIKYNAQQRGSLIKGVKDGFQMIRS